MSTPTKPLTPMKAIRAKCLDCCCNSANEVKLCPVEDCSLYTYRLGKKPYIKREYTEEQRKALSERFHKNVLKSRQIISPTASEEIYTTDTDGEENTPETIERNDKKGQI